MTKLSDLNVGELTVFSTARRLAAGQRAAYLDEACAGDRALRQRVEDLLVSSEQAGGFLQAPAPGAERPADGSASPAVLLNIPVPEEKARNQSPSRQLRQIGDYELLEEIARGGMGVIFKARQRKLDRVVAVKMILAGEFASREQALRFRAEVEASARLQHPNIVAIHETGEQEGQPYFSMDYVEGGNLAGLAREKPLPARRAAAYVKTIAEAIHYAHEQGILHRDLKPSNVLIDSNDQPRVTDFGLAKRTQKESFLTVTGDVMGSPNFMPPEQAGVKGVKAGRYSDVYSLGGILFFLVTGRAPFVAETVAETIHHVLNSDPVSPRLLNPSVPEDIATICLKCLEKEPGKRYATAQEFAEELTRFLRDEPIHARPITRIEILWRWCRRKPALAGALAVALLAVAASLLFGVQAHRTDQNRLAERRQNAIDKALTMAWSGDLDGTEQSIRDAEVAGVSVGELRTLRGELAFQRGAYDDAIQHLEQAVRLSPQSVAAQAMLSYVYGSAGQWKNANRTMQSLEKLSPKTAEDYLFKGLAESAWDPVSGLATLNEGVGRRPTGIARLIRARVRANHAKLTGDLVDAEGAVTDALVAKELLQASPIVLSASIKAHLVAAGAYEESGQLAKRDSVLLQAQADAAALEKYPRNQGGTLSRSLYFRYVGDDRAALEELRVVTEESPSPIADYCYALTFYRLGQFQDALNALAREAPGNSAPADEVRGYITAELPDGPERALKDFHALWQRDQSPLDALNLQTVLRLLGRRVEAVKACLKLREQSAALPPWRSRWYNQLLEYNCDLLPDNALLNAAGSSKLNQCEAHFSIGMTKLAEGDRRSAREHFRQAIATRVFDHEDYDWSRAFLARMEKDPIWPRWVPVKPEP